MLKHNIMKVERHTLWKVSNGWLLLPEGADTTNGLNPFDAPRCSIFKNLKEFADHKPKRERKRNKPTTTKEPTDANIP